MREGLRGGKKCHGFDLVDLVDSELAGEAAVCTESLSYHHQQQAALGSGVREERTEEGRPLLRAEVRAALKAMSDPGPGGVWT